VVMKYRGNTGYLFYPILPCFGNIEWWINIFIGSKTSFKN
jgi:hypothetical protein